MGEPIPDSALNIVWEPQKGPQTHLVTCPVFEVFFGGARGGGKTDGMLGEWASHADMYGEHAIGLMVRRSRTELIETIERSRQLYTPLGWEFKEQEKMWRSPQGARLRFAYLERDQDGAGAIDYPKVRVDTSMHYSGTPEAQAIALSELGAIRKAVGEADYGMLHAVCCEQVPFMVWVNSQWPGAGRQTRLDAYERLRLGLDGLIRYFGVAVGGRSQIRADRVTLSTGQEIMA